MFKIDLSNVSIKTNIEQEWKIIVNEVIGIFEVYGKIFLISELLLSFRLSY